jgi:hypothetical protein
MTPALFAVLLAAVAAPAPAEEEIKPPRGPQPCQVIARVDKDGNMEITETTAVLREEKRQRTVTIDGKAVTEEYVVTTVTQMVQTRRLAAKTVKVYTTEGKEVDPKDAAEKLRKQTIVLMSCDGQKVDPFYLKIIKPDTLVIVPPPPPPEQPEKPDPKKPN